MEKPPQPEHNTASERLVIVTGVTHTRRDVGLGSFVSTANIAGLSVPNTTELLVKDTEGRTINPLCYSVAALDPTFEIPDKEPPFAPLITFDDFRATLRGAANKPGISERVITQAITGLASRICPARPRTPNLAHCGVYQHKDSPEPPPDQPIQQPDIRNLRLVGFNPPNYGILIRHILDDKPPVPNFGPQSKATAQAFLEVMYQGPKPSEVSARPTHQHTTT